MELFANEGLQVNKSPPNLVKFNMLQDVEKKDIYLITQNFKKQNVFKYTIENFDKKELLYLWQSQI